MSFSKLYRDASAYTALARIELADVDTHLGDVDAARHLAQLAAPALHAELAPGHLALRTLDAVMTGKSGG